MKKFLKHYWKYLTSPIYRAFIHFLIKQGQVDRMYNQMIDRQKLTCYKNKK